MFCKRRDKRQKPRDGNIASLARSPYTAVYPAGYEIPEKILHEIGERVIQLTKECIGHNLIDEFTVEEMEREGEFFLDYQIHLMFGQVRNDLERQKAITGQVTIGAIETLRKAELYKQRKRLQFLQKQLHFCIERLNAVSCPEFEMEVQDYGNDE